MNSQENTMRRIFGKFGIASAAAIVIALASITVSSPASARYGGGWHGGGWRGGGYRGGYYGGGWGWGGFGLGLGTGLLLGAAPYYYGGYYGYGPYAYDYYGPPRCYISRRWVWDRYGRRVLRRVRVCY
jgi:hypothetical protein